MKAENTYIMNLEACYIYKDIMDKKEITYKQKDLHKLFSATIPYSLETIRMDEYFPDTFYIDDNKQYTKKIINLTFDKNYYVWEEDTSGESSDGKHKGKKKIIANKNKIRKYLYNNGFEMDGVKYVFYKRGAGKAKNGYALYIQEDMKDVLLKRSRLNIEFKKNEVVDLTSLLAYESLISSGIEFTINLNPESEILLIDDIYGIEFEKRASVTREENEKIITSNMMVKLQNCLTDGQGLLDESVFAEYNKLDKGMMLLRSDMFKNCGFNTKLQEFIKHMGVDKIKDMFGEEYDASKIKLITTPNSLKFLKFAYKFTEEQTKEAYEALSDEGKTEIQKKCYDYWKKTVNSVFGVVKCDKEGNYGNYNRLTYQLLNSIPTLTYDELMDITEEEREYVMLLKNDSAVFRNYLGADAKASLRLEKNMEEGDVSLYENTDLMNALLLVNSDIQYTTKFKKMKSDLISNYVRNLKEGKIRVKDAKYVTIMSNPYEMLLAAIGEYNSISIMKGREVYCPYYEDNTEFCISRNPHINAGNVMYSKNVKHEEYKWFNFSDNVMAVNFYDNDMPDRLQGEDTDSDTNLVIPNRILVEKAKFCEENFPTPINRVKGKAIPRKNNMKELQKLDVVLSNNYIGKIVNMSQIINSYMNNAISKGESKEIIDELYQASSKLSSMSQIEIDKSKKIFDNISMSKELADIRKLSCIKYVEDSDSRGVMVQKMIVPKFFNMISDFNEYRVFDTFNTPLDILQEVLKFEGGKRLKGERNIELKDLLVQTKDLDGKCSYDSVEAISKIVDKCGRKINGLKIKTCTLNEKAKKTVERKTKKDAIIKLSNLSPNDATILFILNQCFSNNDKYVFKKYSMLTLNLLFMSKKIQVLKCFKKGDMDLDEVLVKIKDNHDFCIFGNKYQRLKRGELL